MPKVWVFGKEGSTGLHCQEPGQNKPGPTALEVFSAKRCRRSSRAKILGELHWVCLGLRQEYNALSPGFWQGRVYGAALTKARVYGTGEVFSAKKRRRSSLAEIPGEWYRVS